MKIYTMGASKKSIKEFISTLRKPGLVRLLDIRLKNDSPLLGFTRKRDLPYLLERILGLEYHHLRILAPTEEILYKYRNKRIDWEAYERQFLAILAEREVERQIDRNLVDGGCFLCTEPTPNHCHRRLVAEHFHDCWGDLEIEHL